MRGFVLHELREMVPNSWTGEYKTTCPKCSDSRKAENRNVKCLSINGDSKVFNCFNCGWNGKLVDKKSEVYNNPTTPLEKFAQSRGFSKEALDFMQIGCIVKGGRDYIVYPFYKDGVVVNNKYRSVEGKDFSQDTGGLQCLYGYDNVVGKKVIFLTEGENDTLALITAGFRNVCSCPAGAPPLATKRSDKKLEFITEYKELWDSVDEVVMCTDKDAPGLQWEQIIVDEIGIEKCKKVKYPSDCKDINDMLLNYGIDSIKKCINDRANYPVIGFYDIGGNKDKIFEDINKDCTASCLTTGWIDMDRYYKTDPMIGSLGIVVAVPGMGKSVFIESLMVNSILLHRKKFVIFSPESAPVSHVLIPRLLGMIARKHVSTLTEREKEVAFNILKNYITIIEVDDYEGFSAETLIVLLDRAVKMFGANAWILDNVGELALSSTKGENQTDAINNMLKRLRNHCRINVLDGWLVAHPQKLYADYKGNTPVLTLYDISGSAAFYNRCDVGFSLHRNKDDFNTIDVHILKVKAFAQGKPGVVKLRYDPKTQLYVNMEYGISNRS